MKALVLQAREVPLADNDPVFQFADRLFAHEFDMVVLLTGVGTRQLNRVLATRLGLAAIRAAHEGAWA